MLSASNEHLILKYVGEGLCALPFILQMLREGTETLPYKHTNKPHDLSLKKQTSFALALFSCLCKACLFLLN